MFFGVKCHHIRAAKGILLEIIPTPLLPQNPVAHAQFRNCELAAAIMREEKKPQDHVIVLKWSGRCGRPQILEPRNAHEPQAFPTSSRAFETTDRRVLSGCRSKVASPRATLSLSSSPWETPGCAKISASEGDLWEVPKKIKHVRVSDNGRGFCSSLWLQLAWSLEYQRVCAAQDSAKENT